MGLKNGEYGRRDFYYLLGCNAGWVWAVDDYLARKVLEIMEKSLKGW